MISSVDQLGGNCSCNLGVVGLHRLQYDGGGDGDDDDCGGVAVDGYGRAPQAAVMIMMMTLFIMI